MTIDQDLRIELMNKEHADELFAIIDQNRPYLRTWLNLIDRMRSVEFIRNFITGSEQRHKDGQEYAYVIFENNVMVGRIGVYKIDALNSIGEIGYWIVEQAQGKGIVTKTCKALMDFCFENLQVNRIELKCGVDNLPSQRIAERLDFTQDGILRQAEFLNGEFIDLKLFSFLKSDPR